MTEFCGVWQRMPDLHAYLVFLLLRTFLSRGPCEKIQLSGPYRLEGAHVGADVRLYLCADELCLTRSDTDSSAFLLYFKNIAIRLRIEWFLDLPSHCQHVGAQRSLHSSDKCNHGVLRMTLGGWG